MIDKMSMTAFAVILFLLSSGLSRSEKLALRISGGASYLVVGDINRGIQGYFDYVKDMFIGFPQMLIKGDPKPVHFGLDFQGDVQIKLIPKLWVVLGTGYIGAGNTSELIYDSGGGSPVKGSHTVRISAVPVRLGLSYLVLGNETLQILLGAGVGLYFADYSYEKLPIGTGEPGLHQTAGGTGFGIHGTLGGELKITPRVALIIETQARYAGVGGPKGSLEYPVLAFPPSHHVEKGLLYFWEESVYRGHEAQFVGKYAQVYIRQGRPSGPYVSNVREAKIDFSGLSVLAGIKFYF